MSRLMLKAAFLAVVLAVLPRLAFAQGQAAPSCARPVAGSVVQEPLDLYSQGGVLSVALDYVTSTDADNRTLYCFVTRSGAESPTLHVKPGDQLRIVLRNRVPALAPGARRAMMSMSSNVCGSATMDATSVNMHFHGTNTAPVCHSDGVLDTLVNAGDTFLYKVDFPRDEPAGLYWYHPHVHGISELAVQGGASGAIVVEGIESIQPVVAGLPARILIIRDQNVHGFEPPKAARASGVRPFAGNVPSWDLTVNYVPIAYPALVPAVIPVPPAGRVFWRVLNASADTICDVQLVYDGVPQFLGVVALDGVSTGSQDGLRSGKTVWMTHILLPPGGRAEFVFESPSVTVGSAILRTLAIDGGIDADANTARNLAVLKTHGMDVQAMPRMPMVMVPAGPQRFEGLDNARVTAQRTLFFSEHPLSSAPDGPTNFYITVAGAKPVLFSPANPPAIVTTEGAVEDWTIENHTQEVHEFHIHQIHFKLLKQNGIALPPDEQQFRDTTQVPYWTGKGPFPSITVRMDFRGGIAGDFVYHCHILGHEDAGMMAIIRVLPKG